ncbi:MAG TPA: hypothetical protein VFL12_09670 [Thermoanaerobaculia bacterium]|nr:hypothetical protein [Thermoanaerobaculia bacterium]
MTRRPFLALVLLASAAAAAAVPDIRIVAIDGSDSPRFVRMTPDEGIAREAVSTSGFDFCLRDSQNGAVLRFNASTGAYVVCGPDGFFEQGVGTISTHNGVTTLSHSFSSPALKGLESVHATVNTTTQQGSATVNSRDEQHGTYGRIFITATNVGSADCGSCDARTAINEGFLNSFPIPATTVGSGTSATNVTVLQQFSLNSDFDGQIRRLVAGIGRQGAGPLSFRFRVYSDDNGLPGDSLYESPTISYSDFPALPTIGVVSLEARIRAGFRFWAGLNWNPSTDPLYLPLGTNPDSPSSKIAFCGSSCDLLTSISQFDNARSLYLSADYDTNWLASGGVVPYQVLPMDTLSQKCDGAYYRFDSNGSQLIQLYAENGPGTSIVPSSYNNASARITPVAAGQIRGLDGVAETWYNGTRFSAFSYTDGINLKYCTRPADATDFVCHGVSDFPGGGGYTRIAMVKNGFELSYGNALGDRIYRWSITNGVTGWQSQPLNPLLGQIGNPEFGFPWYAAASSKVGVAYEYQTSSGLPQVQLTQGNLFYGPFSLGTDVPPQGFNPALASRMAGDCSREGLCVFGRFQTVSQKNLVDMVDFRGSLADPEIRTWQIGTGLRGLQFGRAVSLRERDSTALYASYSPSSLPNQYRLQLDGIDLAKYTKFTMSYEFGAGGGSYPLSLSREDGEWGLAHKFGIGLLYNREAGCEPSRIRGHESGGTPEPAPTKPCEIPLLSKF